MKTLFGSWLKRMPIIIGATLIVGLVLSDLPGASALSPVSPEKDPNSSGTVNPGLETMNLGALLISNLYAGRESAFSSLPAQDRAFYTTVADRLQKFGPASEPISVDLLGRSGGILPSAMGYVNPGRGWSYSQNPPSIQINAHYQPLGILWVSPLILDIAGTGNLAAAGNMAEPHPGIFDQSNPVIFDIDGNGYPELTEWVGPQMGILISPVTGKIKDVNGVPVWEGPVSGADLVGNVGGYRTGFEHLSIFDANGDGIVDGKELDNLFIWQDKNQNGAPDRGEIYRLHDLNIESLNIAHNDSEGSFVRNGQVYKMWDWWPTYLKIKPGSQGAQPQTPNAGKLDLKIDQELDALGGPDLTITTYAETRGKTLFITKDKLEALGYNWQESCLALVSPDGKYVTLQDFQKDLPHSPRIWLLEKLEGNKFKVTRFTLRRFAFQNVVFSEDSKEILITTSNETFFYLIRLNTPQSLYSFQLRNEDLSFRMVYGAAFSQGGRFYLPGYYMGGGVTHDSLSALAISQSKISLKPVADVNWLLGKYLPDRGINVPYTAAIKSPELSFVVTKDKNGQDLLMAITGRNRQEGTIITIGAYARIAALSANGTFLEYVDATETTNRILVVRTLESKVTGREIIDTVNPANYVELASKGKIPAWAEFNWSDNVFRYWYSDRNSAPKLLLETSEIPGAFRVSGNENIWSLQTQKGLFYGALN